MLKILVIWVYFSMNCLLIFFAHFFYELPVEIVLLDVCLLIGTRCLHILEKDNSHIYILNIFFSVGGWSFNLVFGVCVIQNTFKLNVVSCVSISFMSCAFFLFMIVFQGKHSIVLQKKVFHFQTTTKSSSRLPVHFCTKMMMCVTAQMVEKRLRPKWILHGSFYCATIFTFRGLII